MTVMSWDDWVRHDATALAGLIRAGQIAPAEATAQVAAGVARLNPRLQGVIELFADTLENPGHDRPNGQGLLHGVPMFLKDLGSGLAGRTQDSGSDLVRGTRIDATDPTIANFLRAGLVPLGRSTTPEFGMTFDTVTRYGEADPVITRNPWNLARTPGGSSGGSAAMVAAGVVPLSMSSDGGGSTRIPAAFCGLVGLKATRGRVPQPLGRNEYVTRVSIDGVVSRTVRDTAAVFEYLTRIPNGGSFIAMGPPRSSYLHAIEADPPRLRVAVSCGPWGRSAPISPQITDRVATIARLLERLGHHVDDVPDTAICDWSLMWETYIQQWVGSRAGFIAMGRDRGVGRQELQTLLAPMTWRHFTASERYDKFDMMRMMSGNNTLTRQWGAFMEQYDVLLTPTLAIRVPTANGPYSLLRDEDLDDWIGRLTDACRFTMPANETGMPAISLPAGLDNDGLPIGAQFYGNFGNEQLLLALAAQIETASPAWFGATPPVHVTRPD